MKRIGAVGFIVVGPLFVASCRETPAMLRSHPHEATSVRFVETDPTDLFSPSDIGRVVEGGGWVFSGSANLAGWSISQDAEMRIPKGVGHLEMVPAGKSMRLEREGPLRADSIYAVRVAFVGAVPASTSLEWSKRGEEFSPERSVSVPVTRANQGEIRLVLGTHPEWTGVVERLSFRFANKRTGSAGRVRVRRIALEGLEVNEDRLVAALARPWKVSNGGEVRNALLGLPGITIRREVEIPEHASLAFAVSVPPTASSEVTFTVAIEVESFSSREVLWSETVAPSVGAGWHERLVDLRSRAGAKGVLLLETASSGPVEPLEGVPAWGNPEILVTSSIPLPPNLVLISVDTLRADHLSLYGYPVSTSPNIDAWARRSAVTFETTVAQAPWTLPSHVSLFTGLNATTHGVNFSFPAPGQLRMMAEILRDAGYVTAAFTGGSYLHPRFGLSQGFDVFVSTSTGTKNEMEEGIQRALDWLDNVGERRPFFLFFHTYEVHDPYYFRGLAASPSQSGASSEIVEGKTGPAGGGIRHASRTYDVVFSDGQSEELPPTPEVIARVRSLYDSSIMFMDAGIGRILSKLKEKGLDDETLVVFTSDHGEAFGEHGLVGHGLPYDHNLLVPLIVALPDGSYAGRRVSRQVRSIDILPTTLEVLGIEEDAQLDGRSLLPLMRGDETSVDAEALSYAALSNYGLVIRHAKGRKYILSNTPWRDAEKREELYDLVRDPGEDQDLSRISTEVEAFRGRALSLLKESSRGLEVTVTTPPSVQLCGTLHGPAFSLSGLKQNSTEPCCKRRRRAGASFCVRPEEALTLNLESVTEPNLRLMGDFSRPSGLPALDVRLTASSLSSDLVLVPSAEGWISVPVEGEVSAMPTVRLRWLGQSWTSGGSPVEGDPELRRQLEALGYLD